MIVRSRDERAFSVMTLKVLCISTNFSTATNSHLYFVGQVGVEKDTRYHPLMIPMLEIPSQLGYEYPCFKQYHCGQESSIDVYVLLDSMKFSIYTCSSYLFNFLTVRLDYQVYCFWSYALTFAYRAPETENYIQWRFSLFSQRFYSSQITGPECLRDTLTRIPHSCTSSNSDSQG